MVPSSLVVSTPCFLARVMYIASRMGAVEFIVIDVLTLSSGISLNSTSISASVSMTTPTFPTSP